MYIIDLSSFSSILKEIAVCKSCEEGNLELFDCGEKATCAFLLMLRCDSCHYSISFWSVSDTFGRSSFPVGVSKFKKGMIWSLWFQ